MSLKLTLAQLAQFPALQSAVQAHLAQQGQPTATPTPATSPATTASASGPQTAVTAPQPTPTAPPAAPAATLPPTAIIPAQPAPAPPQPGAGLNQMTSRRSRGQAPVPVPPPWGWIVAAALAVLLYGSWRAFAWATPVPHTMGPAAAGAARALQTSPAAAQEPTANSLAQPTSSATAKPVTAPAPEPQSLPATSNPDVPDQTPEQRCVILGTPTLFDAQGIPTGTHYIHVCGPADLSPAVALPRNMTAAFPSASVCKSGLAISLACSFQLGYVKWQGFADQARRGLGGGAPGHVMSWWATGDVFDCAIPTGGIMGGASDAMCEFKFHTQSSPAWKLDQFFRPEVLSHVSGPGGCAPALSGQITSALDGNRIRITIAENTKNGLKTLAGILDTGAYATLVPDQWMRDAGYTPLWTEAVSGVGNGTKTAYVYRVPKPMIQDGQLWAPTGQGYMFIRGVVGFDLPLFGPDLLKGNGISLTTSGGRWTIAFPCTR